MLAFKPMALGTALFFVIASGQLEANDQLRGAFDLDRPALEAPAATQVCFRSDCEPSCGACDGCCDSATCGDGCGSCCGTAKAKKNPCAGSHKVLFYDNDFSYLNNPCSSDCCLGDCLKLMPVDNCGRWGTVDVGGQLRLRYHHEKGMGQVAGATRFQDTENDLFLTRLRLYTNWQLNDNVRFYFEGIYADVEGNSAYVPRGIDENFGDILNAFVDLKMTDSTTVRLGRQELLFGAQRTVSPLDWANTRRTFEGVRVMYKEDDLALDAFYTGFVPVASNDFDDADYKQDFYGLYGVYSGLCNATLDFYYLGYDNQNAGAPIASDFSLHTFGTRLNGSHGKLLYEFEGAQQYGRQSGLGLDHSAGFATLGVGRKLDMKWSPTVWFYYDYASGNNIGGDFNRYNQLFPLAHKYMGFIDATQRANIESPNLLVKMKPSDKLDLLIWYYHFMSNQDTDLVPSIGGTPAQNGSKDWGDELDLIAKYKMGPRSNLLLGYSHFWAGNKIAAPGKRDADFFYTQWELNF